MSAQPGAIRRRPRSRRLKCCGRKAPTSASPRDARRSAHRARRRPGSPVGPAPCRRSPSSTIQSSISSGSGIQASSATTSSTPNEQGAEATRTRPSPWSSWRDHHLGCSARAQQLEGLGGLRQRQDGADHGFDQQPPTLEQPDGLGEGEVGDVGTQDGQRLRSVISTWWIGGRALSFIPKRTMRAAHGGRLDGACPAGCRPRPPRCPLRPAARSRSASASSSGATTTSAPSARATSARAATGSTTMMGPQPVARKTARNRQPMAPPPTMSTRLHRVARRPCRVPLTTQARGSARAATGAGTASAMA